MERRKFTREFKLEAVRLIKDRGVSYMQASQGFIPTARSLQTRPWRPRGSRHSRVGGVVLVMPEGERPHGSPTLAYRCVHRLIATRLAPSCMLSNLLKHIILVISQATPAF
jgi:hypothetical protein